MTDRDAEIHDFAFPDVEYVLKRPELNEVLSALDEAEAEQKQAVSPTLVYGLSELSAADWQSLEDKWVCLSAPIKLRILRSLNEASEALFELNFRELGLRSLADGSSNVREAAIELLWTDESEQVMREFIRLAGSDPEPAVRASACKSLGRFILLGEYGDVSDVLGQEAQGLMLGLHLDAREPLELRRRALEALANSSHPRVNDLVGKAYADGNHDLKISAIFAMGRTCSKVWREILLHELDSDDSESVFEATAACGHIQLDDSLPRIGELAFGDDREIQQTAIWALGEIGGRRAVEILSQLEEAVEDEETAAVLSEALDTAGFRRGLSGLDIMIDED